MNLFTTILLEFLLTFSSILFLFKFRTKLGLAPLYILLGAIQFIQANLGSSFSIIFFENLRIYPGSIILFSGVLFAVLLIYIKEGVRSARALMVGIVITNIFMAFMFEITYLQQVIGNQISNTPINETFNINFKYYLSGTAILFIDFLILVIIYQFLVLKFKKLPYFLILFVSLGSILIFDAIAFNFTLFYGTPLFKTSLVGHLLGKSIAAFFYSSILYFYLTNFDFEKTKTSLIAQQERDIFSIIKYKKRYEDLKIEKKRTEDRLIFQLETSLQNISDGFMSLDANWCYTYINKKAAGFLGKTPESLIGKHIWTEFPEGIGSKIYEAYHKAFEIQETIYFEDYYEPLDKWFENRVYPSSDSITIYFTDITEQKKADLALKESENRISTILETEPECIKQLNAEGELIYMNPAGLAMIEADNLDTVKGKSVIDLISPEFQFAFKKLIKNVFNGNSGILRFEIIGLKGTKRWLETHSVPLKDSDGTIISLLGVTRDITDRKEVDTTNQMLLSLIETSDDFVGLADLEGKPIYLNANGRNIVGLGANEKLPASISNFFPEQYQDTIANEHMPSILENSRWSGEAQLKNFKTGEFIPIEMSGFLINDSTNKPIALGIVATDVTQRKKAEEDLINSELLFRRLTSTAPVGIFQTDTEGSVNYVNEEWLDYAGMSFDEALGFGWSNAIHPDDKTRVVKAWQQYVGTGGEFAIEFRFQDKKNNSKWITVKAVETFDAHNNLYGYIGISLDITDRKEAEEQIKRSEKYLENILNNIGDPVFVKDEKSKFLLVNDSFCSLMNLSRSDIIGKTLVEDIRSDEIELFLGIDKQVIDTGVENVNEEVLTQGDGNKRIISTKKTRFIDSANNKFLTGTIRDITERKKAEKEILQLGHRNTLIIETLLDGFILADTTGQILDTNPSYVKMIGYNKDELLTMNINQLEVALNQTEIEERIKGMVGKGFARFNSNHKKKNGEIIDLDVNTFAMQVNEQYVVAAFMKDITERKKVEIELEKHRNNLEELIKIRTEEVDSKNAELQRMNKLFVGREIRMKELKNIIKELQLKNDN